MKRILLLSLFPLFTQTWAMQNDNNICTAKFSPKRITYNAGSEERCVEAVKTGIEIQSKKINGFFTIPSGKLVELETKISDQEVTVQVQFFEEPDDQTSALGYVEKIWLKSELIYQAEY